MPKRVFNDLREVPSVTIWPGQARGWPGPGMGRKVIRERVLAPPCSAKRCERSGSKLWAPRTRSSNGPPGLGVRFGSHGKKFSQHLGQPRQLGLSDRAIGG